MLALHNSGENQLSISTYNLQADKDERVEGDRTSLDARYSGSGWMRVGLDFKLFRVSRYLTHVIAYVPRSSFQ